MSVARKYDPIARDYCEKCVSVDRSETRARFHRYLKKGDRILDAGCGPGADTKAFVELGFDVVAIDGSEEMCKFASEYTGLPIHRVTFEEMEFDCLFDGLWTSYSLVHYSAAELKNIIPKFMYYLKDGGYWYMSFIYGLDEKPDAPIPFYYKIETTLRAHLKPFKELVEQQMWVTQGTKADGKAAEFLHCIVKKI